MSTPTPQPHDPRQLTDPMGRPFYPPPMSYASASQPMSYASASQEPANRWPMQQAETRTWAPVFDPEQTLPPSASRPSEQSLTPNQLPAAKSAAQPEKPRGLAALFRRNTAPEPAGGRSLDPRTVEKQRAKAEKQRAKAARKAAKQAKRAAKDMPTPGEHKGTTHAGVDHAQPERKVAKSTRELLGYRAMMESGVAWLGADEWSATLRLSDINYVAAEQETQEAVVDRWARWLNSFGAGTRLQLNVVNRQLDDEAVASLIQKPLAGDDLDKWREDFNKIVRGKLAAQSGNTVTEKYLTITVQESDRKKAEASLVRLARETAAQLSAMEGCRAELLNRAERLQVLSHLLRPYESFVFHEDGFDQVRKLGTADYVAPYAVDSTTADGPLIFRNGSGDTYHSTLWIRDYPVWMSDRLISELAEIKCNLTVSLHLEPYEQIDGMTMVQRQIAELEMQTISEQKKAIKQGYGEDFIPHRLVAAKAEARDLRAELESSNQKVFSSVLVIGVSGASRDELDHNVKRAMTVIRKASCQAEQTKFMQRDALTTELPVGLRRIPMRRTLTTASAAIIVPFTSQELFVPGGMWYGTNKQSGNAIVADRTQTVNGNGFILGTTGSGKSQAAKAELLNVYFDRPDDDIIIIDPEREYEPLMNALGGSIVRIDAGSTHHLNAMDIELGLDAGEDDPIKTKADFVLSMLGALIGTRDGLTPTQRSLIDRCTVALYREYATEQDKRPMPTLSDLRDQLMATRHAEAVELANALEIYTTGSLNAFAQHTNVNVRNRLLSWDISRLGSEMKTFGMMVILDQVWNRVARNRAAGRRTWLYVDEFHLLFSNPYSAEYFRALFKRARKWGLIPTGITQNIEELLSNEDARLMLANSNFLELLSQNATDADSLSALLALSEEQSRAFMNVPPGCGLLKSGNALIPFDNRMPTDSALYKLFSTKFGE